MTNYFDKSLTIRPHHSVEDMYGSVISWSAARSIDAPYLPDGLWSEWLTAQGAHFLYYYNPKRRVMLAFADNYETGAKNIRKLSKSETEIWEALKMPIFRLTDGVLTRTDGKTSFDSRPIYRAVINDRDLSVIPRDVAEKAGWDN